MSSQWMARPAALITYDGLPISAGGAHTIRVHDRARVWDQIQAFLTKWTTYSGPNEVGLVLYEDETIDEVYLSRTVGALSGEFGPAHRRRLVSGATDVFIHESAIVERQIPTALRVMSDLEQPSSNSLGGPLVLSLDVQFELKDPDSGLTLQGQGNDLYGGQSTPDGLFKLGESSMRLRLGKPSTCGLFLSLPYMEPTPVFAAYITRLDADLPFRLSPKHWLRWQLNRAGTGYYGRRLSIGQTLSS